MGRAAHAQTGRRCDDAVMGDPRTWTPPPSATPRETADPAARRRLHLQHLLGLWIPLAALAVLTMVLLLNR